MAFSKDRRRWLLAAIGCVPCIGCAAPWLNGPEKENASGKSEKIAKDAKALRMKLPDRVGIAARPEGLRFAKVEAIGLIKELAGTGGSPEPGRQRDELITEIRTHNVSKVNELVDSPNTAMAIVEGIVPPGARAEDRIDLRIQRSQRTVASSYRYGWLMPARLREMRVLGGDVRTSDVLGIGTGSVVTRWDVEGGDDPQKKLEGVIVGGGRLMRPRDVSLILRAQSISALEERVALAAQVADAINTRFFHFDGARRKGVANAKSDERIELAIHPMYRRNITRYLTVIDRTPLRNEGPQRTEKLKECVERLKDPETAVEAALLLEALGRDDSRDILHAGLNSEHVRVRFAAAEALAYLEDEQAVPVLAEIARSELELRHNSLRALGVLPHHHAMEALTNLLHEPSNETRYGALRELMERPDAGRNLAKRTLPGDVELYLIPSSGPPLVAISTTRRPAIAVFGAPLPLTLTSARVLDRGLSIRPDEKGRLRISRFQSNADDRVVPIPATVEGLIEGLCALDIGYGGLVATIRSLKDSGEITARLAIDPFPKIEEPKAEVDESATEGISTVQEEVASKDHAWWDATNWFGR